jgi:tetratricopeptide (TPR) repeat protein
VCEFQSRYPDAADHAERAVAAATPLRGTASPLPAQTLSRQGIVALRVGDVTAADSLMALAADIARRDLGATHPTTGHCIQNHALALTNLGRRQAAKAAYLEALDIYERAYPVDHVETAITRTNLADVLLNADQFVLAREQYALAQATFARRLGERHEYWGLATWGMAAASEYLGEFARAEEHYEQAVAVLADQLGADHAWTLDAQAGRARLALKRGDHAAATAMATDVLATLERRPRGENPAMGKPLLVLAEVAWLEGRPDQVLDLTDRIGSLGLPPGFIASEAGLLAARALLHQGLRERAQALVDDLRAALLEADEVDALLLERVDVVAAELGL